MLHPCARACIRCSVCVCACDRLTHLLRRVLACAHVGSTGNTPDHIHLCVLTKAVTALPLGHHGTSPDSCDSEGRADAESYLKQADPDLIIVTTSSSSRIQRGECLEYCQFTVWIMELMEYQIFPPSNAGNTGRRKTNSGH